MNKPEETRLPQHRYAARKHQLHAMKLSGKVELQNVNHPGSVKLVDKNMYNAMRRAFLKILPRRSPGLTESEIRRRVIPHLPEKLFPAGARSGWWAKALQLDLEAKGLVVREKTRPLRWRKD